MKYLLFLFLLLTLAGCKTYQAGNLPDHRLHFGNRGGVTGQLREYILFLDSGQLLFHDPLTDAYEKIGRIKKERLAEITTELQAVQFPGKPKPAGNRNTVMVLHEGGSSKELQWGSVAAAPDEATKNCYEGLMQTVKSIRKQKNKE